MKQSYTSLTQEQKDTLIRLKLLNGCGGKFTHIFVPNFIFKESCQQHDFYYERGGDLFDKFEADLMFVAHMLKQINERHDRWYKKLWYTILAKLYFVVVTFAGVVGWEWGEYRSYEDIIRGLS